MISAKAAPAALLFAFTIPYQVSGDEARAAVRNSYLPSNVERDPADPREVLAWLRYLSPERFGAWGEGHVGSATSLDLSSLNINDEDLEYLQGFAALRELDLSGSSVSDRGLAHLGAIGSLRELDLGSTAVGDVSALSGIPLTRLVLRQTHVDDRSVKEVFAIGSLEHLDLYGTAVADGGMLANPRVRGDVSIGELAALRSINLRQTKVSSAVFQALAKMPNLQEVTLGEVSLRTPEQFDFYHRFKTQEGLSLHCYNKVYVGFEAVGEERLMRLKDIGDLAFVAMDGQRLPAGFTKFLLPMKASLTHLSLNRCAVGDESVGGLKQLKGLVYLDIFMHKLSEGKVEELRGALPNLKTFK